MNESNDGSRARERVVVCVIERVTDEARIRVAFPRRRSSRAMAVRVVAEEKVRPGTETRKRRDAKRRLRTRMRSLKTDERARRRP